MKIKRTKPFKKDYKKLHEILKKQVVKQLGIFIVDPCHPSLRIKKMQGHNNIWEGRISDSYRFTFHIEGEVYWLRRIGGHNIYKKP